MPDLSIKRTPYGAAHVGLQRLRYVFGHAMPITRRHQLLGSAAAIAAPILARAQTAQYRRFDVKGRVLIVVPAHWRVRDENERKNIAASADALLDPTGQGTDPVHVSSLSVVSTPEPPQAIIRVSFVSDAGSQEELRQELQRGKTAVLAELAAGWKEQVQALSSALAKQGMRYLGDERFDILSFASKLAIMISYKRSSLHGGSPFAVTQYHVPMGADKVLVTISIQESARALLGPVLDRVKTSIAVRA
jgi:hypothetical protein